MKPTIYTSAFSKKHDTGHAHPESPARIEVLEKLFEKLDYPIKQSQAAKLEQIMLAHTEDYIFDLQETIPDQGLISRDNETILSPDSYDAALHAAGAVCNAVDNIFGNTDGNNTDLPSRLRAWQQNKKAPRAFCATRPPGHHAEKSHELGFCLFNNVFIGARHAQEKYNIKKIAVVDFDVHHGNGTENMSVAHNNEYPDKPIFYISSHGYPLFPMSGDPKDNNETLLNIHLPDHCDSPQFQKIYADQVFPALKSFAPELLMISAGFDAHKDDPLANINLETEDYDWVTENLCNNCPSGTPVISVLEGGYHLEALKDGVEAHLSALSTK